MVEMGAKVKRKTYKFELKKKYQYVSHYKIKQRPPIDKIKDKFRELLSPKKAEKKAEPAALQQPPKGGFNFLVFGGFILIALILLAIAWLYLTIQVVQPGAGVFQPQVEKSSIDNTIENGDILTTGLRGSTKNLAAVFVDYNTVNLKNYTVTVTTYDTRLPSEVFILNSERFEASTYPDFIRVLRSNLAKRKILLNEITIKQLETLPEGAVVIVPSGAIPKEIIGIDSQLTMNELSDRGIVLIYLGQPFTKMLNGTLVSFTPRDTLKDVPATFDENAQLESEPGFSLFQPLYRVAPLGGWKGAIAYGSVSITTRGNGAFVFVPQTLDGGWRGDYEAAADDISRIVFETPWAQPNSEPKVYEFTNQTNYSGRQYFFSNEFDSPNVTTKVEFIGYPPASNISIRETLFAQLEKRRNNTLLIEQGGRVVSANITNQPVRINAQLREPVAAQPSMFLSVVDNKGNEIQTFPQGNVNVQADQSFDVLIYLDRGEYIVKLVDDESNVYGETYMKVVSIDINYLGQDVQKRSTYKFSVTMDGSPRTLSEVTVRVDNGQYGTQKFTNVDNMRVDLSQYVGNEPLPLGNHTFEFTAGALKVNIPVVHTRPKTIFDEPIFWITLILTGGIVGVGAIFARAEEVFFAIDIPDFPPVARTKIPLSPDVVLSIFDKVNETYRWQTTPLTAAEMKNGFKDIFVQGKPIYITDFNVEYLLVELEKKGRVKESLGYFGMSDWEQKSGHTIEYLALMRRLRDICVNNAIPFTGLGESEEADSVITVVGQQMSIHFYERRIDVGKLLGRVIPTIGHGIAIIMFKSPPDKEYFQTMMNSSPTIGPLIVKMEADSSSLLLLTADELEKMMLEFKSM
ncbi:MAG: hypothetical protein AB1529_08320 [Candidatus Micrarchaeota archaeon]